MEKRVCKKCGEERAYHRNRYGYCQRCYREEIKRYRFYEYGENYGELRGNERKIVRMTVEEGKSKEEIAKELGLNKEYVRQIIKKRTKRVDADGEEEK